MIDSIYWIWFQLMFGFGTAKSHEMLTEENNPEKLYRKFKDHEPVTNLLTQAEKNGIEAMLAEAERIKLVATKKGCNIITPESPEYPAMLQHIYAKPAVLYSRGDLSFLNKGLNFTVVGSRTYSEYGERVAREIIPGLVVNGANILSGLAFGIDSISHEATINCGGKTLGILACGLDIDYPKGNAFIKSSVRKNGAVVSEYPFGMKPRPHMFPPRNRILAGISNGVIVIEAGEGSGSLITARYALDYGRDVFAVPGSIFAGSFKGSHALISSGTAKLVTNANDILSEYSNDIISVEDNTDSHIFTNTENLNNKTSERKELPKGIDDIVCKVYNAMDSTKKNADQIVYETGIAIADVLGALTTLELLRFIQNYPGGFFTIT